MKKAGRKAKSSQYKFRRQTFSFHQYWLMYYTEHYPDRSQKDFASFIKAKSYALAKTILCSKLKEDNKDLKINAVVGYMLHKDFSNSRRQKKLSITDWDGIRACSFPNLNNFLFKEELERPEGYTNKYNKTNYEHVKKIGFQKGKNNWSTIHRKGKSLPIDQRKGMKWTGDKWVEWDKEEMLKMKNSVINALIFNKNNRLKAAEYLNISRSGFYALMIRCETKAWWNENYPIPKRVPPRVSREERSATQKRVMAERMANGLGFFQHTDEIEAKRLANLRAAKTKQRKEYLEGLVVKIKEALSKNNNIRVEAARSLNVKVCTFKSWLKKTNFLVDWQKHYPSPKSYA